MSNLIKFTPGFAAAIVGIFVTIPAFNLIWSIVGLAIFAVFTSYTRNAASRGKALPLSCTGCADAGA